LSCDPERVTGFVDGALDAATAAAVAAHLEACEACRAQVEAERALRSRLRELPVPPLPEGLAARVRAGGGQRTGSVGAVVRWALPLAAVLVAGLWLRGHAPFVAWELARDHDHCFSRRPLPAQVRSDQPGVVVAWFDARGTRLPQVPERVGELALVGARFCPMPDVSSVPHVYYASATSQVSVFVVRHGVRFEGRFAEQARGRSVRLLRVEGKVLGIVGPNEAEVQAFEAALQPVLLAWKSE
jgi:anti-sigma factor RsiW